MKKCAALLLGLLMLTGCTATVGGEVTRHALPYSEEVAPLTGYKNFMRGCYLLDGGETYTLAVSWNEAGVMTMYCVGENGYRQQICVPNGTPVELEVPEDGLYSIATPLMGQEITGLTFSLAAAAP